MKEKQKTIKQGEITLKNNTKDFINVLVAEAVKNISSINKRFPQLNDSKRELYLKGLINEIGEALKKADPSNSAELSEEVEKALEAVGTDVTDAADDENSSIEEGGVIYDALICCKKNGIYPYHTSNLMAAAFYVEAQKNNEIAKLMGAAGVKEAVRKSCGFIDEPELVYMVTQAYNSIVDNKWLTMEDEKLSIVKAAFEEAFRNESKYGGCTQCLIKSFMTIFNKNDEKYKFMFQSASALSGGVAGCNDSACGAYSGAMMVIGTFVGRRLEDLDNPNGERGKTANVIGQKIHDKFIDTYGTTICRDIHENIFGRQFNFRNEVDKKAFKDAGAHKDKCPMVVGIAHSWLCEVLYDEGLISAS